LGTEYAAFIPALRRLGHEVMHFESWNKRCHRDFADLNAKLLMAVESFRPQVMLTVHMEYEIWLETLELIRARGDVATISWAADDSWKYREVSRFVGNAYHAMTTTYDYVLPRYHDDGIVHAMLTQWAASSSGLVEPLPAESCQYAVSFIGAAHGNRRRRIERLRDAGIDVVCFGHGWENGPVDAATFAKIVRDSVISLNFANSRGPDQIKARCFEVPGSGGFLLTQQVEGLERFYIPDTEVAVFRSDTELPAKIQYFLRHPEKRDRIAMAGYRRTAAEHTYEHRLKNVVEFALAAKAQSIAAPAAPDFSQALAAHQRSAGFLRLLRRMLETLGRMLFGPKRGVRAVRRLVFELSWRLAGRHTFTASGWPGRMFPDC
jgi:spore maturation protein CgeB